MYQRKSKYTFYEIKLNYNKVVLILLIYIIDKIKTLIIFLLKNKIK